MYVLYLLIYYYILAGVYNYQYYKGKNELGSTIQIFFYKERFLKKIKYEIRITKESAFLCTKYTKYAVLVFFLKCCILRV